jgi:hypothetical protein
MEATGDPAFSMFNLSLKEDWVNNKKFCHRLSDEENIDEEGKQEAQDRLGKILAGNKHQSVRAWICLLKILKNYCKLTFFYFESLPKY